MQKNSKSWGKKKRFNKTIALTCVAVFTAVNTGTFIKGLDNNVVYAASTNALVNKAEKNNVGKEITRENETNNTSFIHAHDINEAKVNSNLPEKPVKSKITGSRAMEAPTVRSLKELADMSYENMVNTIAGMYWEDITGLFQYSSDSYTFYSDKARVQYIVDAIANRGRTFTDKDDKGIPTLVEVLRSGYYLGYYNKELSYLNEEATHKLVVPALRSMLDNYYFRLGTKSQNEVVSAFGKLVGNSYCDYDIANRATSILTQYRVNIDELNKDIPTGNATFEVMKGIGSYFKDASYKKDPKSMPYYGRIDTYINELKNTTYMRAKADQQWYVNNAIFYLGQTSKFYSDDRMPLEAFTYIMDNTKKYSEGFFAAAQQIELEYKSINSRGENINYKQLQQDGEKEYLPNKYTFDNGAIVMQVGNNVSQEKAKRLYWATKEVESQFFREIGSDKALEAGNPDEVLTIKIFNSPDEYRMNQYLAGINTNNGGMYIETTGTFYTYERTVQDSVYSLEELFRHEFTHYLQGRYLVPGMWGYGELYANDNLTWFEEGTAEFFAGSTRTDGVQSRQAIVNQLAMKEEDRFTLDRLLSSGYASGWDFYNYGFGFASYMHNKDKYTFNKIMDAIKNDDVVAYKKIISDLKADSNKNKEYQNYMQQVIDNKGSIGTPLVSDAYLAYHAPRLISQISSDIVSVSGLTGIEQYQTKSPDFKTFKLKGKYIGGQSNGRENDQIEMDAKANKMLKDLTAKGWSGYETVTCYFTNYKVVNGHYEYDMVFRGLLTDYESSIKEENKTPWAKIDAATKGETNVKIAFYGDKSIDFDGKIVSYNWDFGDGTTSNEQNPAHVYKKQGTYTVTLRVTDDKGAVGEKKVTVDVAQGKYDEENFKGLEVSGVMVDRLDEKDIEFEVEKAGTVTVKVTGDPSKLTWMVVKGDEYVCWKEITFTNSGMGSFEAKPGKYIVHLYGADDNVKNVSYKVGLSNIKQFTNSTGTEVGPGTGSGSDTTKPETPVTPSVVYEEEPNDKFETAKVQIYNGIDAKGTLSGRDNDIFNFNVNNPGEVDIKVESQYDDDIAWSVCSENNTNGYVCWKQYAESYGSRGSFTATKGKYFIKVYSLSGSRNIDYTIKINGIAQ